MHPVATNLDRWMQKLTEVLVTGRGSVLKIHVVGRLTLNDRLVKQQIQLHLQCCMVCVLGAHMHALCISGHGDTTVASYMYM